MITSACAPLPRPAPFRRWWRAWATLLALVLAWDASGADLWLMHRLGDARGFAWQHHPWLSLWLHDRLRLVLLGLYGGVWAWALWPVRGDGVSRRERLAVALLLLACLLVVSGIKRVSLSSCPWDLQAFGGVVPYVSHWRWGVPDGGPGHCFPGGHASGGLAFMVLALPWWLPAHGTTRRRRTGHVLFGASLFVGTLAGVAQTLRGAHFPSHSGWSLVICAGVALAGWQLAQPWMAQPGRARGA